MKTLALLRAGLVCTRQALAQSLEQESIFALAKLYFVTVNLKTGETVFTNTYAEHLKAVEQWLDWMRENPGYD